jgi:hypothetical protein
VFQAELPKELDAEILDLFISVHELVANRKDHLEGGIGLLSGDHDPFEVISTSRNQILSSNVSFGLETIDFGQLALHFLDEALPGKVGTRANGA